jgi:Capsule assembly protein Wzi
LSAYLPLNLEPEMERQIERVLILGDEPILKRPIPVQLVEAALPEAAKIDPALAAKVRRYLERYDRDYALTHASLTGAADHGAHVTVPNEYGLPSSSHYEVSAQAYVQPSDYLLASAGVLAYQGRTQPLGSILSLGFSGAQLDLGYRPHWFSPLTDSSMTMSTEAPITPSITLSNWEPLTRLGFQYELFLTRLSQTSSQAVAGVPGNNIFYNGVESRGDPRLFGLQVSIEPYPGWSIGVNRLLEYGGGSGLPESASFLLRDFFKPSGLSQTQGKQEASYDSRFIFPGKTPFAVYIQYAGTDNSDGGSYLLGNPALSAGIDFPRIWRYFDATFEFSEWQNIWYTSAIFRDGTTSEGFVLGNWGADQRNFNDGVGARSLMFRIGWEPPFGGYLEERARTLVNENYYGGIENRTYSALNPPAFPYHHYYDFTVTYSHPWKDATLGGDVMFGRDVYGESFTRVDAFVRYGGDARTRDDGALDEDGYGGGPGLPGAEMFIDLGIAANQLHTDVEPTLPQTTSSGVDPHLGIGARRAVTTSNDLGVRLEFDEVAGHTLVGVRALDWRYRFTEAWAAGAFIGVDRYGLATPAYSVYGGLGVEWRNFLSRWLPKVDLDFDFRHAQNIARDHVLATDAQGPRPETFYKVDSLVLYLSRHF